MDSLLNKNRPPIFCPGCSHERVVFALDESFKHMGLKGNQIAMVSDIGCSGLLDTFFNTHAFHGLHGRALTYAVGLKLAQPDLHVIVTMGDGGIGIGGAHFLSACRRNLNLTLLILNNFNYGMTGGQFSTTTPTHSEVSSSFLNRLEKPIDAGHVAAAAGAPFVARASAYQKSLPELLEEAIRFEGFSVVDVWGVCPGRFLRRNKLTPNMIESSLKELDPLTGPVPQNIRPEYQQNYRETAGEQKTASFPKKIETKFKPLTSTRQEIVILGSAGQRILTAGEILGIAGLSAGMNASQKNEYNITVMTGPSITELILSLEKIDYTGLVKPAVIIALAEEGVNRRKKLFSEADEETLIIQAAGIQIPPTKGNVVLFDHKSMGIKKSDWALAALAVMSKTEKIITPQMLQEAIAYRFRGKTLDSVNELVRKIQNTNSQMTETL